MTDSTTPNSILLVDDDPSVLRTVGTMLREFGYHTEESGSPAEALDILRRTPFHALVTDIKMPKITGLELLAEARQIDPDLPVVLMTGHAELSMAIEAVKRGAFDFITKPFDLEYFIITVEKAVRQRRLITLERDYRLELEATVSQRTSELRQSMEELRVAKERAEEASRLKSEFIATISHEVRTPVNGIVGIMDIIRDLESADERAMFHQYARESALRLTRLMDGILGYSRIISEAARTEVIPFNPVAEIAEVAQGVAAACENKGLAFTYSVSPDVPATVAGDRQGFGEIIRRLTDNAVKFTSSGVVALRLEAGEENQDDIQLVVVVEDTGIGVLEGWCERIFEPFTQVDGSYTRSYEGAGLGLSIVKRLAELAHGTVRVDGRPSGGSAFRCTLWYRKSN